MHAVIETLFSRKSVRVFTGRRISEQDTDLIIDSAIQAPTAGNQMLYTILRIEDETIRRELSLLCDHQPFIASAPLVLIFLADCRRWLDCYMYAGADYREPGLGDILLACEDALIAAQNSVIAAEALGIGSCYIGDILEHKEQLVDLLGLDPYVLPITLLVYGYPTEQQRERPKPKRFARKYIVQKDRYRRLTEVELREMFREQRGDDFVFDQQITAFCDRKYMSDFAKEMTRSVGEYLKSFER